MENVDATILGAIIAAVITAIFSLLGLIISKEQKISDFRQQWINSLRNEISELLGCTESVIQHARAIHEDISGQEQETVSNADVFEKLKDEIKESERLYHQIQLRINPKEHGEILSILEEMRQKFLEDDLVSDEELHHLEQRLIKTTQNILKIEWNRVKVGEPVFRAAKYLSVVLIATIILISIYSLVVA